MGDWTDWWLDPWLRMTDDALRQLDKNDVRPIIDAYLPGCAPERRECFSRPLPNDPYRIARSGR